jgi:integrase
MILTAVRMDAARGARPAEFDGDVWTIPADRIKGREGRVSDFRVPLSDEAQRVVERMTEFGQPYLFQSPFTPRPVTDAAVEKALREMGEAGRPHGLRTSFRTWCQDHGISYDVAEAALGHVVGGRVERAYARSDLLDRRRPVMNAWAAHVTGCEAADVVAIRG